MGHFGEDLRMERLARGIALEKIATVTKISQRHLLALEEEKFRLLPGGILAKGIVRSYVSVLGLDASQWTERFMRACSDAGQTVDDDERGWTTFAANVGKGRILKREAVETRRRWAGALLLLAAVLAAAFLTLRYYGLRAGWWSTLLPFHGLGLRLHAFWFSTHEWLARRFQ